MMSFLDPVPDPDRVRQAAATFRALHQDLSDQVE
jgi:hypothetical protein